MKTLLLVIDLQNSFINKNTKNIPIKIGKLIQSKRFDYIAFTKFINSEKSLWVSKLDFHGCITAEDREIVVNTNDCKVFEKSIYTALNDEFEKYLFCNSIDTIYLCGLDTDACVYKTSIDLFENGYNVFVLKDYCMCCSGVKDHKNAIKNLRKLIGKDSII